VEETALPAYFGEWLKRRRKELDLTQAELADRAGCSVPALRKIEAGIRRPSKQLAGLLARALEIPSEDQTTFIKVARGELNVERLRSSAQVSAAAQSIHHNLPQPRVNLPIQLTPLIGREAELAALGKLLVDPQCRLLTITGMGGIGKTRLAIEFACQQQILFPGGVYYVPLGPLNSPEFIVTAIAESFGLTLSGTLDLQEQLFNYLAVRARQALLLVLDNLEHLLHLSDRWDKKVAAAVLLAELLQSLPNLKILATSRERINIQGEWTFELQGLPFPMNEQSDHLENYSAPALFIQRARQVKTGFDVLPDERSSLARVCELVEGTPLAIELAAAWVGVLSIDEIAREIASNLDFLTTTMRDVSERHRSLRATFEHSWKLLSAEEQEGLSRLAVFRGGFQRVAAEQVARASLPILMSLFSKSLLLRKENGRYDLHEVVRQYALSYLGDDLEGEATRDRHCKYYLGLVHGDEKGFSEANQWVDDQILVDELDNLRAAMSWGIWNIQVQYTLKIATALGQFWYTHGYWREGLEWLDWGLTGPGPVPHVVRAKALTVCGRLKRYLGEYDEAIAMLKEGLAFWDRCDDVTGIAQTLCNLGAAVLGQGDYESAMSLLEEALSVAIQQGDRRGRYCSLENLGHLASRQGNSQRAIELYSGSLALAQEANDENQAAILLNALGDEFVAIDDYDRAEDCFNQCATICHRLGNRIIEAYVSGNRGYMAMKQGNYSRAFTLLAETILILQELGDKENAILCLEPMAFMALERHFPERAARLLGAGELLRQTLGVTRAQPLQADYERYTTSVRSHLDKAAFEAAWAEGSAMTYEQAIAYAVGMKDAITNVRVD
jgi:predicted ATPase/transcriptional regulator with XRE-family HTH domain